MVCMAPLAGSAASFDCAKAKRSEEKAICANAELSRLDEVVSKAYRESLQRVSAKSQVILRDSQRQWLKYRMDLCVPPRGHGDPSQDCLRRQYEMRLRDLKDGAATRVGSFLFYTVHLYSYTPCVASDDDPDACEDGRSGNFQGAVSRIDSPLTSGTKRWNDFVGKGAGIISDDPHSDFETSIVVQSASADLVNACSYRYEYPHGAAHGMSSVGCITMVLSSGRMLDAADLFDPDTDWKAFLSVRATEGLKKNLAEILGPDYIPDFTSVPDVVSSSDRWRFTSSGLEIVFNYTDLYTMAFGPGDVLVPWPDLQAYLRKPLPFALPR